MRPKVTVTKTVRVTTSPDGFVVMLPNGKIVIAPDVASVQKAVKKYQRRLVKSDDSLVATTVEYDEMASAKIRNEERGRRDQ